jgi:ubiquinone/menaquinone biosynthesis C-methylase UbiE
MTQTYFDQIAGDWDSLRASMFDEEVREIALERADLRPESVVVDLGAGTGFLAEALAPRVAHVHAVDSSVEMLSKARAKLSRRPNVEFHLAEGTRIPLPDGSVDAVLANMYLHHAPDPGAAVREAARLLKPGGRVVITDLDRHEHAWLLEEHQDRWPGFHREDISAWLKAAGFVNVLVEDTQQDCSCSSGTCDATAAVSIFIAVGTKPIPGMEAAVESHYRKLARGGAAPVEESLEASRGAIPLDVIQPETSCCCAPPAEVESGADFSLGCGNPLVLAGLKEGQVVLDIGSGAGADVFPAAQRVGPHGKVIGIDRLPDMLARARATAARLGYQNVEFRLGDALEIPLEDGSVDVVISNCVINLVQDKGEAFRQAYRVLRPGGVLSISDIVTDRNFSPGLRSDPQSWAACITGALPESEYLGLITAAGFTGVTATRSQAWAAEDGTQVYSLLVKAEKPVQTI